MGEIVTAFIVGPVFGALGFLAKIAWDGRQTRIASEKRQFEELVRLKGMLDESKSIFQSQNYQARRLMKLLRKRLPAETKEIVGFDETFSSVFDAFEPEEKELHGLIRSTTQQSMLRANKGLREWIEQNQTLLHSKIEEREFAALAAELVSLRDHLNAWQDKYEAWIPNQPKRSLVYLDDEKRHGTGFPKNLESALNDVLNRKGMQSKLDQTGNDLAGYE